MNSPSVVFLPCRSGSERVPNKNIKKFGQYSFGLFENKINQLLCCKQVDYIFVSTNDISILEFCSSLRQSQRIFMHHRDDSLASSLTSTDELIIHAMQLVSSHFDDCHILWTHVTSPFITASIYEQIISNYFHAIQDGFDSLMTITPLKSFLWNDHSPINYCRDVEKWPRTQTIDVINEVNSAVFMASLEVYRSCSDRIGRKPFLHGLNKLISYDIDWPEDFQIAETMCKNGIVPT